MPRHRPLDECRQRTDQLFRAQTEVVALRQRRKIAAYNNLELHFEAGLDRPFTLLYSLGSVSRSLALDFTDLYSLRAVLEEAGLMTDRPASPPPVLEASGNACDDLRLRLDEHVSFLLSPNTAQQLHEDLGRYLQARAFIAEVTTPATAADPAVDACESAGTAEPQADSARTTSWVPFTDGKLPLPADLPAEPSTDYRYVKLPVDPADPDR